MNCSGPLFSCSEFARSGPFWSALRRLLGVAIATGLALLASGQRLRAELVLHDLFTDHAVLQKQIPVPVWGWADPGGAIEVRFAQQVKAAQADESGNWMVVLDPLDASAEPAVLTVSAGDDRVEVKNVLVGEVWVCSGQSNMAMTMSRSLGLEEVLTEAEKGQFEAIRLFKVPVKGEDERQNRVQAIWSQASPDLIRSFSGTAFYFGRALHRDRGLPVGLIQSANGGTNAYSWINGETYAEDPVAEASRQIFEQAVENHPAAMKKYEAALVAWKEKVAKARAEKRAPEGRAPREPLGPNHVKRPAGHYHAMIAPLQPFAMRGVIWYQGEANSRAPFADHYRDLMFALVDDWRGDWAAASGTETRNFPFYLVQLPNYANGDPIGWPAVREQMFRFWKDGDQTGMVVTLDAGEASDIHPRDKRTVGERLARFARGNVYAEDIVYQGPVFSKMKVEGGEVTLDFDHAGGGLVSRDDKPLRFFELAGEDRQFHPAEARLVGNRVVVSSEEVPAPVAVRYAWSSNPEGPNFFNAEGLPALPFRSDDWQLWR